MNTTTESYAGILKLLVAYELQHTLSQDEFLAIEHYQHLEYWLWVDGPYDLEAGWFISPNDGLATWVDDSNPQATMVYVLRQGEA